MNTGRLIRSGGFSLGLGYGAGFAFGILGGMVLCVGCAAAAVGGFVAVKSHLRKRKEERERMEQEEMNKESV
jgi:hypothetical protein